MVKDNKMVQTEIGLLPEDWEVEKLIDVSEVITKGTTPKEFLGNGVIFVKIESFLNDKIIINKCLSVSDFIHNNELKRSILKENDILFAIAGATIGKCAIVHKEILPANTNQALAIIRLSKDADFRYIFYVLKSNLMVNYIIDNAIGGAQPNLNLQQVGAFQIPLPPLPEQEAIASALSDADAWIESLEQLIAKKRLIKQGAMQELLSPKENWEERKLGELGEVKMCKRIFQYQTSEFGDIPFYKIGTFGKIPDAFISRNHYQDFKNKFSFPKIGEILISAAGTIGRTVVYDGEECYFQDSNIVWINNQEEIVSNKFLKYILEVVKYNTEGGTIQRLYNSILKDTIFNCPSLTEQTRIATILSDMDLELEGLGSQLAKARQVKQGMMQELLTGRVRLV